MKLLVPWKENYDNPRQSIKKLRHNFANKGPHSQSYGFSSSCVWMWEFYHKEGWVPENWCFWTVVLEKILESALVCKEINQSFWKEISPERPPEGLTLKAPVLWPPPASPRHPERPWAALIVPPGLHCDSVGGNVFKSRKLRRSLLRWVYNPSYNDFL